ADLDRLYAAVKAERGTLDIVFANAGVGSQLKLGEITAEHIDETFDVNVKGTIFTVQKALPLMGKGGSIILTGSSAGTTGAAAFTAYSASKAAVRNLARTWAEDLKGTGVRVNVLSPGATATELAKEALGEEGLKAYGSMTALQRMGDPAEVGAAAAFLASSDSSFMTGSEVAVDGGLANSEPGTVPRFSNFKPRQITERRINDHERAGRQGRSHHRRKQRNWLGHSQALRRRRRPRRDHRATRERAKGGRSLDQEKRYDGRERRIAPGRSGPALCRREGETWSHRHSLRERGRGNNRSARSGNRGPF